MVIKRFLNKMKIIMYYALALVFGVMFLFALFFHAKATPFPIICNENSGALIIRILIGFIICIAILEIGKMFLKISNNKLVFLILAAYVIIQVLFILLFPLKEDSKLDAAKIVMYAKEILHGKFLAFKVGNYLNYYPNNIGITLFFAFLFMFLPKSIMTIRFCNVIFTTATAWLIYKLYKEVTPREDNNPYGILLFTVIFIPAILMNNLTYGDVISTTLCTAALLSAIKYINTAKTRFVIYTAILLLIGNFIRQVAFLFLAAILVYWFIKSIIDKKVGWKKTIAGMILIIIMFNLPLQIFNKIGTENGILKEAVGKHAAPTLRWIDIGFAHGNNLGYWDRGRNSYIFLHVFKSDPKKASNFFLKDIQNKYRKAGPLKVIEGYLKKTFWMWTEGTYMVNKYAFMRTDDNGNKYKPRFFVCNRPLGEKIDAKNIHMVRIINEYLHSYNLLMMALLVCYLIYSKNKKDYSFELFIILITLYVGFYLIWEIKSRYLFGLYPVFILISYKGLCLVYDKISVIITSILNSKTALDIDELN